MRSRRSPRTRSQLCITIKFPDDASNGRRATIVQASEAITDLVLGYGVVQGGTGCRVSVGVSLVR